MMTIKHQFADKTFYFPTWRVKYLFLGTFNPTGGQKVNYYYGRESNYFWPVLSDVFKISFDPTSHNFFELIKEKQIACMDMIDSVEIMEHWEQNAIGRGYQDSKIIRGDVVRNYNTCQILKIIDQNPGVTVFSTWGKGSTLREWNLETEKIKSLNRLVSPSKAARVKKGQSKKEYILKNWLENIKVI